MSKAEPLYLLLGPETGLKNSFLNEIRQALAKRGGGEPEEHRFYAFDTPVAEIVSLLRNASLFSSSRMVLYHGAEEIRRKEDLSLLRDYAKNPSPDGVLVLISENVSVDRKLSDTVPGAGKKIFWELFDNQKKSWVLSCFKRHGAEIDLQAAELFLDIVNNDTLEMERWCRDLCAFLGPGTRVTAADIEKHLCHGKEETVFSLFESVAEKDLERSLEILDKLLLEGSSQPVQLLAGLLWQFRKLHALALLLAQGGSLADGFTALQISGKRNQGIYAAAAGRFSPGELENIIVLFADFDEELRSSRAELQSRLMELFLFSVIRRGGVNILSSSR